MNATYRAALCSCFQKHLNYDTQKYKHLDLNPSRIKKDEAAALKILETISTKFINPLSAQPLLSISNWVLATNKVSSDILLNKAFGKVAMDEFIRDCLSEKKIHCFFDPIKKKSWQPSLAWIKWRNASWMRSLSSSYQRSVCKDIAGSPNLISKHEGSFWISIRAIALVYPKHHCCTRLKEKWSPWKVWMDNAC